MLDIATRMKTIATSDFIRQSAIVFVASTLINALGYAFHFAISRRIGVVAYGVLSALNAGYMISLTAAAIIGTVVVKYVAELRALGDDAKLAAFVQRAMIFCSAAGTLTLVVGLLCTRAIAGFLHVRDVRSVAIVVTIIALTVVSSPLRAVFQGLERFVTFSCLGTLESLLKAVLGIGLVYAGFGVAGAFGGWAIGTGISLAAALVILLRNFGGRRGPVFIDVRRLALTMGNVSAATLTLAVLGYADVLLVKHFADPTSAGLYGALSLSGKILFFFVGFIPLVVLPKATRIALAGGSALPILKQALSIVVGVSLVGLFAYGFAPRLIVTMLAGPTFAGAAPYVFSYAIAMVLLGALGVIVSYKIGVHRFDFVLPVALVAAGEIAGIVAFHKTLAEVITVLIVGNALALAASLYRLTAPLAARGSIASADAA